MWLWQANRGEEIHGAKVLQVDLGSLHSVGALIGTSRFDIKILHQSHASEKRLASLRRGKELGDATDWFEDAILALQSVGGGGSVLLDGEFKQGVNRTSSKIMCLTAKRAVAAG